MGTDYLEIIETIENDDLQFAIRSNPTEINECCGIIDKVFAEITGERDEKDWHWLVGFQDGKVGYITGGCDYTGWDCQSFLNVKIFKDDEIIHVPLYDNANQSPAKDFETVIIFLNQARGMYGVEHEDRKSE